MIVFYGRLSCLVILMKVEAFPICVARVENKEKKKAKLGV